MRSLAFFLSLLLPACLTTPSEIVVRDGGQLADVPQDTGSALPDVPGDTGATDAPGDTGATDAPGDAPPVADSGQDAGPGDAGEDTADAGGDVGTDATPDQPDAGPVEDVPREVCDSGRICNPWQWCSTGGLCGGCTTARWDCNGDGRGNDGDGCEADFRSDPRNCGGCRRPCGAGQRCVASACVE